MDQDGRLDLYERLLVPSTRRGVVVVVTVQYVLLQLWLLSRSKTVRWRSYARALTVGTLFAPVIGLADVAVTWLFGGRCRRRRRRPRGRRGDLQSPGTRRRSRSA